MNSRLRFSEVISTILEGTDLFTAAIERHQGVDEAKQNLTARESELTAAVTDINSQLAGEIRRQGPSLDVWLTRDGRVQVKYGGRARQLGLRPAVTDKKWVVDDSPFGRAFRKYYRDALNGTAEALAAAVVKFFNYNYKSLGGQ